LLLKKLLLVEDDREILDLLGVMIADFYDGEIISCVSAEDAIEAAGDAQDIALVVSDFKMKGGGGPALYAYMRKTAPEIPFGLISTYGPDSDPIFQTFHEDHHLNFHLAKPFQFKELHEAITKALTLTERNIKSEYVRLSSNVLKRLAPPTKVYIKLSDQKFVAIVNEGEFETSLIDNYIRRGIEDYYLHRDDFAQLIYKQMKATTDSMSKESQVGALFVGVEEVQLAMIQLGVSEQIVEYTETLIEQGISSYKKYSKLNEILDLLDQASGYIQKHAYLTGYISVAIAKALPETTEKDHKRLVMASLFKDISLIEFPEFASIFSLKDSRFASLAESDKHKIRIHMHDAANLLDTIPEFDTLTRELVVSHHERARGDGFPRGKNISTLQDLSIVFMLSCQFSHDIIQNNLNFREITLLAQNYAFDFVGARNEKVYHAFVMAFQKLQPPR
jgi:response regulator RpfG family c-di-GMP phosphodiesterase